VVEAVVVILSSVRFSLYALLQCSKDSEYGCKEYDCHFEVEIDLSGGEDFEVFHVLLAEDGESSPPSSGNFQSGAA
jgi:hypothetical protein